MSCSKNYSKYASIEKVGNGSKNFIFTISEKFDEYNDSREKSKIYAKMNVGEQKLLEEKLKEKKYCYDDKKTLKYSIISKQEKIYDVTFSHLIEQNYKSKPVVPVIFFGQCLSGDNNN
jgi:hypothetical protein